jgi:serine/threonine-protein kinase
MVLTEEPTRPRELDPRIPEALELVIQRAMAKDPAERYGSMVELDRALGDLQRSTTLAPRSLAPAALAAVDGLGTRPSRAAPARISSFPSDVELARSARPTIVTTSLVLGGWLVGGLVTALGGLVRILHDGEITLTESLLLMIGCIFAAATPIALYVAHLQRVVWPNSVRAVHLARDLRQTTVAVFVVYGSLSSAARLFHTVLWRHSVDLTSGWWDIALFVLSVAMAIATGGAALIRRLIGRAAPPAATALPPSPPREGAP